MYHLTTHTRRARARERAPPRLTNLLPPNTINLNQEPGYKRACAYLDADAGAGWTLFQDMANPDRLLAAANGDVYVLGDRLLDLPFLR